MLKKIVCLLTLVMASVVCAICCTNTQAYADVEFTEQNNGYGKNIDLVSYDNNLVVADTDNNRIRIVNQDNLQVYSFGKKGYLDDSVTNPTLVACDNQTIYVVMGNNDFIKIFDYKGSYLGSYDGYNENNLSYPFYNITSIVVDTYGDLYALHLSSDGLDNCLLKLVNNNFIKADIQDLEIDETSRLLVSTSGDSLILVKSNSVTVVDSQNMVIKNNYDITATYNDVEMDYLNNLYFYQKNSDQITKLSAPDYQTNEQHTLPTSATNAFVFNQISGNVFVLDDTDDSIKTLETDFVDHLSSFEKPTDYLDTTTFTQGIQLATIKDSAIAYNYPYTLSSYMTLNSGDFVIVLDDSQDFWYCMVTNKHNYNETMYINKNHLTKVDMTRFDIEQDNYIISTPQAVIYKYPTTLKATEAQNASISLDTPLSSGASIKATKLILGYNDYQNMSFFEIELENDQVGYVTTASVVTFNTTKDAQAIKPNATIKITSELEFVNLYTKVGDKYKLITTQVLLDGTRVRLVKNYDKQAKYCEIKYIDNEGQVATAYVETKYIALDGITFEIVIAILLIVVSVVLGLILIVVIKKSKHRI